MKNEKIKATYYAVKRENGDFWTTGCCWSSCIHGDKPDILPGEQGVDHWMPYLTNNIDSAYRLAEECQMGSGKPQKVKIVEFELSEVGPC